MRTTQLPRAPHLHWAPRLPQGTPSPWGCLVTPGHPLDPRTPHLSRHPVYPGTSCLPQAPCLPWRVLRWKEEEIEPKAGDPLMSSSKGQREKLGSAANVEESHQRHRNPKVSRDTLAARWEAGRPAGAPRDSAGMGLSQHPDEDPRASWGNCVRKVTLKVCSWIQKKRKAADGCEPVLFFSGVKETREVFKIICAGKGPASELRLSVITNLCWEGWCRQAPGRPEILPGAEDTAWASRAWRMEPHAESPGLWMDSPVLVCGRQTRQSPRGAGSWRGHQRWRQPQRRTCLHPQKLQCRAIPLFRGSRTRKPSRVTLQGAQGRLPGAPTRQSALTS